MYDKLWAIGFILVGVIGAIWTGDGTSLVMGLTFGVPVLLFSGANKGENEGSVVEEEDEDEWDA